MIRKTEAGCAGFFHSDSRLADSRLAPYFTYYFRADFEFVATITVMCEGNCDERKIRCVAV